MKVLFVLEYFPPYHGGVEKLFYHLTKSLSEKSVQITVLTAAYDDLPLEEYFGSIKVVRIKARNRYHFSFNSIARAISLAKECDVIHSSTYNAALPAWLASKFSSKPIILTVHEYWNELWWRLPFLNFIQRLSFWSLEQFILFLPFDKIIGVSTFTSEKLKKRLPRRSISMIYNGQKSMVQPTEKERGNYYLYVGRLGVSKGIDVLVEAIALASNRALNFKLVIPTSPKHIYQYLNETLSNSIASKKVELLHNVDDVTLFQLMHNAKAIIIPSYSEGFGFVATEATSLKTPIIHSGKGALNEVVGGDLISFDNYSAEGLLNAILDAEDKKFKFKNPIEFPIEVTANQYLKEYTLLTATRPE